MFDDCLCLLFLHVHRELSTLSGELPEESDQVRFLHTAFLSTLMGSVGLILIVTLDYSPRLVDVFFHTSPSLLWLSSCPPSSYFLVSLMSSTLWLSGTSVICVHFVSFTDFTVYHSSLVTFFPPGSLLFLFCCNQNHLNGPWCQITHSPHT
jgi:hypothetical protein